MNITRYLEKAIQKDLEKKMVFLGGPRQVGKTTFAKHLLKEGSYLSWDDLDDREIIKSHKVPSNLKMIILDEIHKYARWRMLAKGLFDKLGPSLKILITGSARLDHFRKGGDSLVGRYHYYRLHPLSLLELDNTASRKTTIKLLNFGGFPEPYQSADSTELRRWRRERISRVVQQDIADLHLLKEISLIELLVGMLPSRVGSQLSIKSLQEDLEVSPNTVTSWLRILENVYYCFRITPYGPPKIRAVKKSNKLYLWDWTEIESPGARFENLVASQLLKYCHFIEDTEGYEMSLCYMRDVDLREIDFVVLRDKKPIFAIECKTGEREISPHLKYFRDRTKIPKFYQVHLGKADFIDGNIRLLPFEKFCQIEKMP